MPVETDPIQKSTYMDHDIYFNKVTNTWSCPSLNIYNVPAKEKPEFKAMIRAKLEQRESVTPLQYMISLLESEINEAIDSEYEDEMDEECRDRKKKKNKLDTDNDHKDYYVDEPKMKS